LIQFVAGGLAVVFTDPWRGLLELVGAVNPVLCGCFGEGVLEDAAAEVV
jgi:hypothetical protein